MTVFQRRRGLLPYLLLAPGLLWLLLFFAVPLYYMARISLERDDLHGLPVHLALPDLHGRALGLRQQFMRSFLYAGAATLIALR